MCVLAPVWFPVCSEELPGSSSSAPLLLLPMRGPLHRAWIGSFGSILRDCISRGNWHVSLCACIAYYVRTQIMIWVSGGSLRSLFTPQVLTNPKNLATQQQTWRTQHSRATVLQQRQQHGSGQSWATSPAGATRARTSCVSMCWRTCCCTRPQHSSYRCVCVEESGDRSVSAVIAASSSTIQAITTTNSSKSSIAPAAAAAAPNY